MPAPPSEGRFITIDPYEGDPQSPPSLHRYLYGLDEPVGRIDPNGQDSLDELMAAAAAINFTVTAISNVLVTGVFIGATASPNVSSDDVIVQIHGSYLGNGYTAEGGVDLLWQKRTNSWFFAVTGGFGTNPLGMLPVSTPGRGLGYTLAVGPVFNMSSP